MDTYGSVIRTYADGIEAGSFDKDLDSLARTYTVRLLRHVTTVGIGPLAAFIVYSPGGYDGRTRDELAAAINSAAVGAVLGVAPDAERAYLDATTRAVEIVRNV